MSKTRRVNLRAILKDPALRKVLMTHAGIALQAREGIVTSQGQMELAYDKIQEERVAKK